MKLSRKVLRVKRKYLSILSIALFIGIGLTVTLALNTQLKNTRQGVTTTKSRAAGQDEHPSYPTCSRLSDVGEQCSTLNDPNDDCTYRCINNSNVQCINHVCVNTTDIPQGNFGDCAVKAQPGEYCHIQKSYQLSPNDPGTNFCTVQCDSGLICDDSRAKPICVVSQDRAPGVGIVPNPGGNPGDGNPGVGQPGGGQSPQSHSTPNQYDPAHRVASPQDAQCVGGGSNLTRLNSGTTGGECQAGYSGAPSDAGIACTLSSGKVGHVEIGDCTSSGADVRCCIQDAVQPATPPTPPSNCTLVPGSNTTICIRTDLPNLASSGLTAYHELGSCVDSIQGTVGPQFISNLNIPTGGRVCSAVTFGTGPQQPLDLWFTTQQKVAGTNENFVLNSFTVDNPTGLNSGAYIKCSLATSGRPFDSSPACDIGQMTAGVATITAHYCSDVHGCPTSPSAPTAPQASTADVAASVQGIGANATVADQSQTATVRIYNVNTTQGAAAYSPSDKLTYDPKSGNFVNPKFNLGIIPSGKYKMVIQMDKELDNQLKNAADATDTFALNLAGGTVHVATVSLLGGDVAPSPHGDNFVNAIDYNALIGCMAGAPANACFNKKLADLNDDGVVDQKDLDILLSNYGSQGFAFQTNQFTCTQDPTCTSGKGSLQLCSLICSSKNQRN